MIMATLPSPESRDEIFDMRELFPTPGGQSLL